jgi:hypothetical protein
MTPEEMEALVNEEEASGMRRDYLIGRAIGWILGLAMLFTVCSCLAGLFFVVFQDSAGLFLQP